MAEGLDVVRGLAKPVRQVAEYLDAANGITIERVKVPLGVVGVIYESRPNVTADAGALRAESWQRRDPARRLRQPPLVAGYPRRANKGLREANLPEAAISLVPTRDRSAVDMMLQGLDGRIDVIVPRGGKSLVAR